MISNRYILAILLAALFMSCNKEPDGDLMVGPWDPTIKYLLCNRECNMIGITSAIGQFGENTATAAFDSIDEAAVNDYVIRCDVNCADELIYPLSKYRLLKRYRILGDPIIEDQIKLYLKEQDAIVYEDNDVDLELDERYPHSAPFYTYEYRSEECTSISITSTSSLFGEKPGVNLKDYFEFFCNRDLITDDKQFLGPIGRMSVNEYLSYHPMALPYYIFHFTQVPPETPLETDFIVDIGLVGGKHLKDTTHVYLKKD